MSVFRATITLRRLVVLLPVLIGMAIQPVMASEPGSPSRLPSLKPLTKSDTPSREAYNEVLSALYAQLESAESADAAELLEKAIETLWARSGSDTVDLLMQRANIAMKSKDYPLAERILASVTAIQPRYGFAWNQLATVHFLQDNHMRAMHQLRQVLALDPRNYKAIEGLSIILRDTGDNEGALEVLRRALEVHPHLDSAKQAEEELSREVEGQNI